MWLLLTYILTAVGGIVVIYFIGLGVEQAWPAASLPAFLILFFGMLWVAWIVSVKITAPKAGIPAAK